MAIVLKNEALPLLGLFNEVLGRTVTLECQKYNTQCIFVVETEYSAAMRHLSTTEGFAVGIVSEVKGLPRMIVGSCTRNHRCTKETYSRSGWRPLRSKLQPND